MAFRTNKTPILQTKSASGSVATFNTALAMPLSSCNIAVNAWQEGSGTPSPSNVRPLHAWSGANLVACGVNLWNGEYTPNTWISVTSTGATAPHTGTGVTDYIPIIGGTSYYKFETGSSRASYFDSNKDCIGGGIPSDAGVITTPANAYYVRFTVTDEKIASFGLNYPSTDTDYHAFEGQSFTIQIGSTVYGGEYDARTGVLTVTHGFKLFDGTENWLQNGNAGVYVFVSTFTNNLNIYQRPEMNIYQGIPRGSAPTTDYTANWNAPGTALQIRDSRGMTPTDFKQLLSQTNLQLKFALATPTTIQLPPCPIDTLRGENNIWADTGNTSLTYKDLDIAKRGNFREVFKLPS